MDITSLRVFNVIHKLGITEEEFKDIEGEQSHTERTGLYISAVKQRLMQKLLTVNYCICVNHDDKHKIVIRDMEGKPRARVLFKTLIPFSDLPKEVYTLHQIACYRALDTEVKHKVENLEELKDRICDRFADDYPKELGDMYEELYGNSEDREFNKKEREILVKKQLKALYWLFGDEYNEENAYSRVNVPRMIKVFQRNNRRIAIIQMRENWDLIRNPLFRKKEEIDRTIIEIKTFKPKDVQFNYVCPNREFAYVQGEGGEVWLDDELFERVNPAELYTIVRKKTKRGEFLLLKADKYKELMEDLRAEIMFEQRQKEEDEAKQILAKNIKKQFKKGKVVRYGIVFRKNSFSYEGITVKGSRVDEYIVKESIPLLEEPNFMEIFKGYVEYILKIKTNHDYYPYVRTMRFSTCDKSLNLKVGNIKISVEPIKKYFLVNGFRITKQDLEEVIKCSIGYKTQKRYDKFVEHTSKVNLELQKVLRAGVLKFEIEFDNTSDNELRMKEEKMVLVMPIVRENEKNFILINKEKYGVKNCKALMNLANSKYANYQMREGSIQMVINQLHRSISKITPKEIADLIKQGQRLYTRVMKKTREEAQKRLERSKEFLTNAIRLTNAVKEKGDYVVNGLSGRHYYVKSNGDVWTLENDKKKYLCLVDLVREEAEGETGLNDKIARRLLMLSKDRKVAKEIWDKGDKMDKIWLDIMENKQEMVANA